MPPIKDAIGQKLTPIDTSKMIFDIGIQEPYVSTCADLIFLQVKPGLVNDSQNQWNPLGLPNDLNQTLRKLYERRVLAHAEPLMIPGYSLFRKTSAAPSTPDESSLALSWKGIGNPRMDAEAGVVSVAPHPLFEFSRAFRSELVLQLTVAATPSRAQIVVELNQVASVNYAEALVDRFVPACGVGGVKETAPAVDLGGAKMAGVDYTNRNFVDFVNVAEKSPYGARWNHPMAAYEFVGWDASPVGPEKVEIAIVDTGIALLQQPKFDIAWSKLYYDQYPSAIKDDFLGHGTAVASIIGAPLMSGVKTHIPGSPTPIGTGDFSGILPGAKIWPFNVLTKSNSKSAIDIIAYLRALNTLSLPRESTHIYANLVNISITSSAPNYIYDGGVLLKEQDLISKIYKTAGRLCISCSGNHRATAYPIFSSNIVKVGYPAKLANVISVGAVTIDSNLAEFSNVSISSLGNTAKSEVSVLAPGKNVLALMAANLKVQSGFDVDFLVGTSFAAPIVTGCLGRLLSNSTYKNLALDSLTALVDLATSETKDFSSKPHDAPNKLNYVRTCGSGIFNFGRLSQAAGDWK